MKNVMKALFLGILILIINIGIGGWGYHSITGLLDVINNNTSWLAVLAFIMLLLVIALVGFYLICQGALAYYLIDKERKFKEKCDE
jgi:SNF family Na+-dependent transporter